MPADMRPGRKPDLEHHRLVTSEENPKPLQKKPIERHLLDSGCHLPPHPFPPHASLSRGRPSRSSSRQLHAAALQKSTAWLLICPGSVVTLLPGSPRLEVIFTCAADLSKVEEEGARAAHVNQPKEAGQQRGLSSLSPAEESSAPASSHAAEGPRRRQIPFAGPPRSSWCDNCLFPDFIVGKKWKT